jgi:hypothetical protein
MRRRRLDAAAAAEGLVFVGGDGSCDGGYIGGGFRVWACGS